MTSDIDFETPVFHDQLYAQLLQEIRDGERYWVKLLPSKQVGVGSRLKE